MYLLEGLILEVDSSADLLPSSKGYFSAGLIIFPVPTMTAATDLRGRLEITFIDVRCDDVGTLPARFIDRKRLCCERHIDEVLARQED